MLDQLIQGALQKVLTRAVSRQVDRAVTQGVAQANQEQERVAAFLSGWYVGLQLTYAGGFLVAALALCVVLGLILGERQVLYYFLPLMGLMLGLILWARSRMVRVLYWSNALVVEARNGETVTECSFSQMDWVRIRNGRMTILNQGKHITLACHPLENRPAYDELVSHLKRYYPQKIRP